MRNPNPVISGGATELKNLGLETQPPILPGHDNEAKVGVVHLVVDEKSLSTSLGYHLGPAAAP